MGSLDWLIWKPVVAGYGTLAEVHERWTLDDLLDANEAIDVVYECEQRAAAQARRQD